MPTTDEDTRMNNLGHRSVNTDPGYFRRLGSVHVHVDAGDAQDVVDILLNEVKPLVEGNAFELKFKLNSIAKAVAGKQRTQDDFKPTYESHTPGEVGHELFDTFATIGFPKLLKTVKDDNEKLIHTIEMLLKKVGHKKDLVIESERINGMLIDGIWQNWEDNLPRIIPTITDGWLGENRSFTAPIEIHHAIDFTLDTEHAGTSEPPVSIGKMLKDLQESGIVLGGLFLFQKEGTWSFRSSQFAHYDDYVEVALTDHQRLRDCLSTNGLKANVWTITEQILGVWKTGDAPRKPPSRVISVPSLAQWERGCEKRDKFWVVTSDFLGDVDPDVEEAMQNNLGQGVEYTYFLRSYADVQRLRNLVRKLIEHDKVEEKAHELVKAVLLAHDPHVTASGDDMLKRDYFITISDEPSRHKGYRLNRFERSGNIKDGRELTPDELKDLLQKLVPIAEKRPLGSLVPDLRDGVPTTGAILFTDLENSTEWLNGLSIKDGLKLLKEYDLIVAYEVSRARGEVLKSMGDGYMCIFRDHAEPKACASRALRCATRLQYHLTAWNERHQDSLSKIPNQRIAVACGDLRLVERSHGYDVADDEIAKCSRMLNLCKGGHILVTQELWQNANRELQWKPEECMFRHPDTDMKGFMKIGPVPCLEILWAKPDGTRVERMLELGK